MTLAPQKGHGFVLGKFMPPHQGHVALCEFARAYCENLTILVCSLEGDPIPGHLRYAWMSQMFPTCQVKWCTEDLPQLPEDHPDFWAIWSDVVSRYAGEVEFIFTGEPYGRKLAEAVNAVFVPLDRNGGWNPVSATAVRANPFGHWDDIPGIVRPYYVGRVCIVGPESTGKTHLANALAASFNTICVPEYGRLYTETFGLDLDDQDLLRIAHGQWASAAAAKVQANRIQIEDTDPVLTAVWAEMLLGSVPPQLTRFSELADLYVLCDVDVPWVNDGTRYFPGAQDRQRFGGLCERALRSRRAHFVVANGGWEERQRIAEAAIRQTFPGLGRGKGTN
ncbi:AAA family ATPase [Brevundimonas aveniformis]|uniref:AAA family ATPase n=1 Tax=Brevundimonas aveniformis TaxID=370977 RepID=UPI0024932057|nr:AAA family ATPase [Brevundimonas aveniformis]